MEVGSLLRITTTVPALAAAGGSGIIAKSTNKVTQFTAGIVGLFAANETAAGVAYNKVRLLTPIADKAGLSYTYVYFLASAMEAVPDDAFSNYYVTSKSSVNVRLKPDTAKASLLGTIAANKLAGKSNGFVKNGFLLVRLANPINGTNWAWISTLYVTRNAPAAATESDPDPKVVGDKQPISEVIDTRLDNALGDNGSKWFKWVGLGLLIVGAGLVIWRIIHKRKKQK